MTTPVRYISDTLNGCDTTENRFLEIQALDAAGVNVALNKAVTTNFAQQTYVPFSAVTDGSINNTNYCVSSFFSPAVVVVDLGAVFDVASVTFWHYIGYAAIYHGVLHEISTDGVNWVVIFDSSVNGEFTESSTGHVFNAPLTAIVSPFPSGVVTSQPPPDGQNLTITFSTTNTPTSGMASLNPDATNPAGAVTTLGVVAFGTNTGTATFSNIPPGNYTPTITLTNAAGTRSVSGTQPVSIVGISGSPTASAGGTTTSTVSSVAVSPATVSLAGGASTTFTAVVNGTNSPSQAVMWATTAGTITQSGVLTAPVGTSTAQTVTVTATSQQDASKSAAATVTIAASSDTTPPAMVGALSFTFITATSCVISWPAATDNVAVTGYELSIDNGATYTNIGNVLTITKTGLVSATPYYVKVRAVDAAGNKSLPLSGTATTLAPNVMYSATPTVVTPYIVSQEYFSAAINKEPLFAGEYGRLMKFGVQFDLSGATSLSIVFTRPNGTILTVPATFGTVPIQSQTETFLANQYCSYTFASGDLDQAGIYTARVSYTDATKHLLTPPYRFVVAP